MKNHLVKADIFLYELNNSKLYMFVVDCIKNDKSKLDWNVVSLEFPNLNRLDYNKVKSYITLMYYNYGQHPHLINLIEYIELTYDELECYYIITKN